LLERLMTEEQRTLFRATQAVMSLLEGFSDYVMDDVGRDLVSDVERISAQFHERRQAKRSPFERAIMRLTGMDVKMEQYRKGEQFVSAIAQAGGAVALNRLWSGPRRCAAIDDPSIWLRRMELRPGDGRPSPARPGARSGGAPTAIALSPILAALPGRTSAIRAAPGARIVTLSREGLTDEPVEDASAPPRLAVVGRVRSAVARAPRLAGSTPRRRASSGR
jgi:hypothetical protein